MALEETSDKNELFIVSAECAQVITARADTIIFHDERIMTIIPEETDERGIEVQCLKW